MSEDKSTIFRLYTGGSDAYKDWNAGTVFPYNKEALKTIADPDGGAATHEITSIPSPFARIDLVKSAFRQVCAKDKNGNVDLDGNTIFHKMVSDSLDVAEIFFNIDKYKDKIEIIQWDAKADLNELINSDQPGCQYLGDALDKYLKSDSTEYNFDRLDSIYLLNYVNGPDQLNIIGATSPATLFFSNANDLTYVKDVFFADNDMPFDAEYQPLYKRDFQFVKYLFVLKNSIANFAQLFPEVDDYLNETYKEIADLDKKEQLRNTSATDLDELSEIPTGQGANHVEVLGIALYQKSNKADITKCQFVINATKTTAANPLPLVLPTEEGSLYTGLRYTTGNWTKNNHAPYFDAEDIRQRTLPQEGAQYPYLTISDFLEDQIIKIKQYDLNSKHYFNGNLHSTDKSTYLLPVKPLFFEYFTADDLRGNMPDGKPMLEMETLAAAGAIKVTLRIPITGGDRIHYIEYTRKYYTSRAVDVANNEGAVTQLRFSGFVMPLVRFTNPADAIYNAACLQNTSRENEFTFFNTDGKPVQQQDWVCRNEQSTTLKADNYLVKGENIGFIRVSNPSRHCNGLIVPIFKQQSSNNDGYEFAIDLGTSNTHIEYRKPDELASHPLEFGKDDSPLCPIFTSETTTSDENERFEKDYMPSEVGAGDFRFPTRTVLSCAKSTNWNLIVDPFKLVNIPLYFGKRRDYEHNKPITDIKWGKDDAQMEAYIRCIMLMLRYKVLLNDGNLQKTKITWFYPISMAPRRLNRMKAIWDKAYAEYFGANGATNSISESSAPIQYFFSSNARATNLVNVDIGGGTTDIAFAKNKEIVRVTSFRFAGNTLFEDSLANTLDNGIIDTFKPQIFKVLGDNAKEDNRIAEIVEVFKKMEDRRPSDMAAFLFSLKDNAIIKEAGISPDQIDLNHILQEDDKFKIVFIIFYTAIVYHIAQIIKREGLELPRHISFSGNGSKVLRAITANTKDLATYTKKVFEEILQCEYDKELDIIGLDDNSNSKESTCKGGIIADGTSSDDRDKVIVMRSDNSGVATETYEEIKADSGYLKRAVESVKQFFDFVLNVMPKKFDFDDYFGVDSNSMKIAKEVSQKDIDTFMNKGIEHMLEETDEDKPIKETFFFYPIKGVLQSISEEIHDQLKAQ